MKKRKEYERYMGKITDAFIEMQSNIVISVGQKSDNCIGFQSVIWNGGLDYKVELNGALFIKGVTHEEIKECNGKVALEYIKENILTYNEWCDKYNTL
jgi:hypothetical protein